MTMRIVKHLLLLLLLSSGPLAASVDNEAEGHNQAKTYRLKTIAVVRDAPEGRIVDIWDGDTLFTSNVAEDEWVKVTGTFPNDSWQPSTATLWVNRYYVAPLERNQRVDPAANRPEGIVRYIEVDKSDFELRVIEEQQAKRKVLLATKVAVGMDRCLPKEKGGRCYYTEPGEYAVRWKVHDPEGIEWCIPESMEKEYSSSIAQGKRCFRGAIGNFALNIGKSYAIHGTSNPGSLGRKVSHGCIRTANNKMSKIYELMAVGDKVYIVE